MSEKNRYGVIGYPVEHSLSPEIHAQFANQFGVVIDYKKYEVHPDELLGFINEFFTQGGKGLNVTVPHKMAVIEHLDKLTDEARVANSVNTIFVNEQGLLVGDTTDGEGLMLDLTNKGLQLNHSRVLVVGAGGASQSVLLPLLKSGASVEILNRTPEKVDLISAHFSNIGQIKPFDSDSTETFDYVISSISEFNFKLMSQITNRLSQNTFCYDLNYGRRAKIFKQFAIDNGVRNFADGLGMLICQAALSYQIWQKVHPETSTLKI